MLLLHSYEIFRCIRCHPMPTSSIISGIPVDLYLRCVRCWLIAVNNLTEMIYIARRWNNWIPYYNTHSVKMQQQQKTRFLSFYIVYIILACHQQKGKKPVSCTMLMNSHKDMKMWSLIQLFKSNLLISMVEYSQTLTLYIDYKNSKGFPIMTTVDAFAIHICGL